MTKTSTDLSSESVQTLRRLLLCHEHVGRAHFVWGVVGGSGRKAECSLNEIQHLQVWICVDLSYMICYMRPEVDPRQKAVQKLRSTSQGFRTQEAELWLKCATVSMMEFDTNLLVPCQFTLL